MHSSPRTIGGCTMHSSPRPVYSKEAARCTRPLALACQPQAQCTDQPPRETRCLPLQARDADEADARRRAENVVERAAAAIGLGVERHFEVGTGQHDRGWGRTGDA